MRPKGGEQTAVDRNCESPFSRRQKRRDHRGFRPKRGLVSLNRRGCGRFYLEYQLVDVNLKTTWRYQLFA